MSCCDLLPSIDCRCAGYCCVATGLVQLRHYDAVRFLSQTIQSRSSTLRKDTLERPESAAETSWDAHNYSSGDDSGSDQTTSRQRQSYVFSNDCKSDERQFNTGRSFRSKSPDSSRPRTSSSANTARTAGRRRRRLVGITCVATCPVDSGKNILTYRESKQYQRLMKDRLKWGRAPLEVSAAHSRANTTRKALFSSDVHGKACRNTLLVIIVCLSKALSLWTANPQALFPDPHRASVWNGQTAQ